jgi:phosphohistidine phosphatase SixA
MLKMLTILIGFVFFAGYANGQGGDIDKKTIIYLVRHAEKDTGNNPGLTQKGMQRSGALMRLLADKRVSRIYVTQYRRTQLTADSLSRQMHIDTVHYFADTTGNDLVSKINEKKDWGKTILIVGHSNTIPNLVRKLGITYYITRVIPDNEFDNLYMITYKKHIPKLTVTKYGAPSSASAKMQ